MEKYNLNNLYSGLKFLDLSLSELQIDDLLEYYKILMEKNKVMNLTAITDFDDVVEKHFIDSLSIVKAADMNKINSMIDIGTGAGFPGIPIKIAFPDIKITLIDSVNKKINFLQEVIDALHLEKIEAIHVRAENLAIKDEYREKFDLGVSRAVANLSSLSEYCIPFVNVEGCFIAYKSGKVEEELQTGKKAIEILGGKIEEVVKFQLPNSQNLRSLVRIQKIKKCKQKYPRKAGLPKSDPLE